MRKIFIVLMFMQINVAYGITCEDAQYLDGDTCVSCPDPHNNVARIYYEGNVLHSLPDAVSPAHCYLFRGAGQTWWIWRVGNPGLFYSSGKCFYNPETQVYENCEELKRFSECKAGFYRNEAEQMNSEYSNTCSPCQVGTYLEPYWNLVWMLGDLTADTGFTLAQAVCDVAPVGTYVDAIGAANYTACPDGYTDNPAVGQTDISGCKMRVPAGYYVTNVAGTNVAPCPAGTYVDEHFVAYGAADECNALCASGVEHVCTENGCIYLYAAQHTSPAIHIAFNDMICYANLGAGARHWAISLEYNNIVYSVKN